MKQPKPKKCRHCKTEFQPRNSLQVACSIPCGIEVTRTKQAKVEARRERSLEALKRKQHRDDKERIMRRSEWLALAQVAFNKFIRLRDKGKPCISCGTTDPNLQYAAGHYRTVGSCPELRYTELNCHSQCNKNCNLHKSGNIVEYRINLVKRIGIEAVQEIEGPHEPLRLTIPEIKELTQKYRKLAKELENDRDALVVL